MRGCRYSGRWCGGWRRCSKGAAQRDPAQTGVLPLDLWTELIQHAARLQGDGHELGGLKLACAWNISLTQILRHESLQWMRCHARTQHSNLSKTLGAVKCPSSAANTLPTGGENRREWSELHQTTRPLLRLVRQLYSPNHGPRSVAFSSPRTQFRCSQQSREELE